MKMAVVIQPEGAIIGSCIKLRISLVQKFVDVQIYSMEIRMMDDLRGKVIAVQSNVHQAARKWGNRTTRKAPPNTKDLRGWNPIPRRCCGSPRPGLPRDSAPHPGAPPAEI